MSGRGPDPGGLDKQGRCDCRWRRLLYGLVLAFILIAPLISIGASYPDSGNDPIEDAPMGDDPMGDAVQEANASSGPLDASNQKVETEKVPAIDLKNSSGGAKLPLMEAGSKEGFPSVSTLLNKMVWFEIENRTLNGTGPYGRLLVNRIPTGSPVFNRLLEDAGYAKVREFEGEFGSCSWWENPLAPKLPCGESDLDMNNGTETVQVKRFYVGCAFTKTYHYPDCRWAKNIPAWSQVWFSSPEEARASGYVPCGTCNPP